MEMDPCAAAGQDYNGEGQVVDDIEGWSFWRFDLRIKLGPQQRSIEYCVQLPAQFAPHQTMRYAVALT